jgi:hypothetical protein
LAACPDCGTIRHSLVSDDGGTYTLDLAGVCRAATVAV